VGNVANSKLDDGIRVDGRATGTLLTGNAAMGSGDDGIDVDVARRHCPPTPQVAMAISASKP